MEYICTAGIMFVKFARDGTYHSNCEKNSIFDKLNKILLLRSHNQTIEALKYFAF